jgi:RNA polymerase-interacting CarD/CdnL/TRCF family regulator
MPDGSFDEAQSWRDRAKRTRAKAKNNHTKAIADIIADTYEHVAQQIELRLSDSEKSN